MILEIKTLEDSYHDPDDVMLHACFQVLVDFMDKEADQIDWDTEIHREPYNVLKELYDWWKGYDGGSMHAVEQSKLIQLIELRGILWS